MSSQRGRFAGCTVLITGANGFLGQILVRRLAHTGAAIHAISRTIPAVPTPKQQQWWCGDLTDGRWLQEVMAHVRPQIIYHLASPSKGGQNIDLVFPTFEGDLRATVNVLVAATQCGSPHVFLVGSLEEPVSCGPADFPASPYAAAKMAAGLYGRMFYNVYNLPVTTLRVFMAYGPGQKSYKIIPYTILSLLKGESPEFGSATRLLDWIYADDVITAFLLAAEKPETAGLSLDLGSGELVSIREVVEQIHAMIPNAPALKIGALSDRKLELVRSAADAVTTRNFLGWTAVTPLRAGLAQTIEWYRERLAESLPLRRH
jgi:UDP-glucose 4-epimerase